MALIGPIASVDQGGLTGLAPEAMVRTPCGPRRAEFVRPGDLIVTRGNGLRPVRMVWTQTIDAAALVADPSRAPVRLNPRAIGPMMPQRPLVLAPDHRVWLPPYLVLESDDNRGCLIPARELAGTSDACYMDRNYADRTFYNLVFDRHEIIVVDGLPVETFHPCEGALAHVAAETRDAINARFPSLRSTSEAYPPVGLPTINADAYLPSFA